MKSMPSDSLTGFRLRRERVGRAADVDEEMSLDDDLAFLSTEDQATGRRISVWRTVYRSAPNKSDARGGGHFAGQLSVHVRWIVNTTNETRDVDGQKGSVVGAGIFLTWLLGVMIVWRLMEYDGCYWWWD